MSEQRFTYTVAQIAHLVRGSVRGAGDTVLTGINLMDDADPADLTFVGEARYAKRWPRCRAAAAVISEKLLPLFDAADARPLIAVPDADWAIIELLRRIEPAEPPPDEGIHPSACVHPTAVLGAHVRVGPQVTIDRDVRVGADVVLYPGVRLYADVVLGDGCVLHANAVVRARCKLGARVLVHQNASIGADGFGYWPPQGGKALVKVPHIGDVVLEDDVEIGANSCIDRGKFGSTVVGAGTKIDNLCQIAHNCRIGRGVVIAACAGIGGSVTIGDGVQIGGAVGLSDHIAIGPGARVGGGSSVYQDVPAGATWLGGPAGDAGATKRQWVALKRLPELLRQLHSGPGSVQGSRR